MRILIDMNLSPDWVLVLRDAGYDALHWLDIGDPKAEDEEILDWARSNRCVVFTHDLDFGAILAATKADYPSVFQVRIQDVNPHHIGDFVVSIFKRFEADLIQGALISVDREKSRARILPLN